MFDFEKLEVYQIVKDQYIKVIDLLRQNETIDKQLHDHLKNAMLFSVLNLVQSSGRIVNSEKKELIAISRGFIFECSAIIDLLKTSGIISGSEYQDLYENFERISKMLFGMYKSYNMKVD